MFRIIYDDELKIFEKIDNTGLCENGKIMKNEKNYFSSRKPFTISSFRHFYRVCHVLIKRKINFHEDWTFGSMKTRKK